MTMRAFVAPAVLIVCFTFLAGCGQTPQLGGDEACMNAADALWTAVSAKRTDLLDQSANKIESLHSETRLPDGAFESLSNVVAIARTGEWIDARTRLRKFIRGQRPAVAHN